MKFPREISRFIEVYGTEGTLFVPDPNCFGGPVRLFRPEDGTLREVPLMYDYPENSRALGLADMGQGHCHRPRSPLRLPADFPRAGDDRGL